MCEWGATTPLRVKILAEHCAEGVEAWKTKPIDSCIAPLVAALQAAGIDMRASCCGHGKGDGMIVLADGRDLIVKTRAE